MTSRRFRLLESSPESYLHGRDDIFPVAAGRSFFEPLLPPGSVAIGWCSNTVHWLSAAPCPLIDDVFCPVAPTRERDRWAEVAAADWEAFLLSRAAELVPGAKLVIQDSGVTSDGRTGAEPIFAVAKRALEALASDGRLRRSEASRIFFPAYYRSREEYVRPIQSGPLAPLWKLEAEEWTTLPDTFLPALQAGGSAAEFAAGRTGWLRGFTEPVFFGDPLDADRDSTYRRDLADEYYATVHALIEAAPEEASTDWVVVAMRLSRTAAGAS